MMLKKLIELKVLKTKKIAYENLKDRYGVLFTSGSTLKEDMEMDSINHLFEGGLDTYGLIISFLLSMDLRIGKIYDIGCAYGHQSELFLLNALEYVGVNDYQLTFYNKDKFSYSVQEYPFTIEATASDVLISVLCLTWNIYLRDKNTTLRKQLKQCSEDFRHCILYLQEDKLPIVKKYFEKVVKIEKNLYYLWRN